nr:glutathione S-transferase-like [Onthophagus taurus]
MSIKVTYFDITALGEPIRYLLTYGNEKFDDVRIERSKWPELKPSMPFGQMPTYEEDGKVAHQSLAICRYLAKKYKIAGADDWEALEIDSIVDTVNDFRQKIGAYHYEQDEAVKEAKKGPLFKETIPYYLEKFEKIAKDNDGHLAVKKLTWADLYFAGLLSYLNMMANMDLLEGKPSLQAVRDNVFNLPAIKAWNDAHKQ